jgi:thiol:disulfide interchange protein DsbD
MNRLNAKLRTLLCLLATLLGGAAFAQDPLPPEQVFMYTARADAERVYLNFTVLDGYYLYRARFGFDSATSGVTLGAAVFPRGETHTDEFFGEQEIYRGKFEIAIPYRRSAQHASLRRLRLVLPAAGLDGHRGLAARVAARFRQQRCSR